MLDLCDHLLGFFSTVFLPVATVLFVPTEGTDETIKHVCPVLRAVPFL